MKLIKIKNKFQKGDCMKHKKNIIIISIVILLLLSIILINVLLQRKIHNPKGTIGNTAGNLNNKGLFCEQDGIVYFSNAYDNGSLYSMNADETNVKKLSKVQVQSLNVAGNYLYYYQTGKSSANDLGSVIRTMGLYRSDLKGKNSTCFIDSPIGTAVLIDDYIYFQNYVDDQGFELSKISVNKGKITKISSDILNPACAYDSTIYYNGTKNDHYLYSLDTITDSIKLLYKDEIWNPVYQNNVIYFMDLSSNYRLCKYDLFTGEKTILSKDRVDTFNVSEHYVYYQTVGTNPALKRVRLDGSDTEVVQNGIHKNINITSTYVYFADYFNDVPVYKTDVFGSVNVTTFDAAKKLVD